MPTEISPSASVTLDGSGNGQVSIGPPSGTAWRLRLASVSTSSTAKSSTCILYRGSTSGPLEVIDQTFLGNSSSSGKVAGAPFFGGQVLWAKWAGGDPGAQAVLQVYGQQGTRSQLPFDAAVGEGFPLTLATVFQAGNTVINSSGDFVYSGTPAHGNLIASVAGTAGPDDGLGNAFKQGVTTYLTSNFAQLIGQQLNFTGGGQVAGLASGQVNATSPVRFFVNGASFVAPSGDPTGVTDSANIAAALASGYCVLSAAALAYAVSTPVRMPTGAVLDGGGATISPGSAFSGTLGLLQLAASTSTGTLVRDLVLLDNYTVANLGGVYYSTSTSVPDNQLRHVRAQGFTGTGITCTASAGSASAHLSDCVAYGNMGDGFALTSDQLVSNCEAGFNMGHGFHLLSGASNVYLSNCLAWYSGVNPQTSIWPAWGTSCGYFLEAPTQYSHLTGCHAQQNGLHGFAVGATSGTAGFCYECSITGCGADTNSAYGAGGVGSGIFVSGVQSCVIANNVGGNNGGLSPGSQLWGIQAPGGLVATLFHGNTIFGSSAAPNQIASRWKTLTLINGWTAGTGVTPQWSFTDSPPNSVQLIGTLNGAAATSAVFAIMPGSGVGLPVRPASLQMFPLSDTTIATAGQCFGTVDAAGNLTVNCGTLVNRYTFQGNYSIDA